MRHGLVIERSRRKKRSEYVRWQRPAAMQLWQLDIVYGPRLVDTTSGEVREARIVTGVDDHSRDCVIARVVERATGRATCLAFSAALARCGVPEEVLTDNGKQFTDRFGQGGEVLFDKICRRNGIAHRLTQPRSPTTTGKIERFHQTLRRELLDDARPFTSLVEAQAALDDWVREYNASRPHQALEIHAPVTPAQRFQPAPDEQRELLPIWLPAGLAPVSEPATTPTAERALDAGAVPVADGGPVEFDRVVPPSGNLSVAGRQFWLGPARAGQTVRFWASVDVIHLSIAGARVKSLRSHLTPPRLRPVAPRRSSSTGGDRLARRPPDPRRRNPPRPPRHDPHRDRHAAVFDPDTRELLRARPNPLTPSKPSGYAAHAPPARHPGHAPNPSPSSAASAQPARSASAAKPSRSDAPTPDASSPSTSASTPSRSNSTTRPAPSAARPPTPSSSSKAAATTSALPKPTDQHSLQASDRGPTIPNRSRS